MGSARTSISRGWQLCRGPLAALAISALILPGVAPTTLASSVVRPMTPRFQVTDRGSIAIVANTLLTCPTGASCTNARNGTGGLINNNDFSMVFVDADGTPSTFDSSTADLGAPVGAEVLFAGLYWGAESASVNRGQVLLAVPGDAYQAVAASQVTTSGNTYMAFADVTPQVAALANPNGTYAVANVQANLGSNKAAGWSLVIVYRDVTTPAPLRNLTVFDGFLQINTVAPSSLTTSVSGFITPATGPVTASVGLVTFEGDLGLTGDRFRLNGVDVSNVANPATNAFNSSISDLGATVTTKNPNYLNQLGFDADLLDGTGLVGNSATSASLTFTTSGDVYFPTVLTFAVDVFQPAIAAPKGQSDVNGGVLLAGDEIEYTIDVTNEGNDPAIDVVFRDPIPAGATYVPDSASIVSGPGAGVLTDAPGDDRGEFDAANGRLVVRLGTGATASAGGVLAPLATTRVRFRVRVDDGLPPGTAIENQGQVSFRGQTLGGSFSGATDGDDAAAGDQPTVLRTNAAPVARDDPATTAEDTPVAITILANDSDVDGNLDPTTVTITTGPAHGTVAVNPTTGVVIYTPAPNYTGPDQFTYRVCDSAGACDRAVVDITVTPVPDPPAAANDTATTDEDTPVVINVLANDTDPEGDLDPTTVSVPSAPAHGSTSVNPVNGRITYTPDPDYHGPDTFTYQVCDLTALCDVATVVVTVVSVNDPPQPADDVAATAEDVPVTIPILANDNDPDGIGDLVPGSVTVTGGPAHGSVSVNPATGVVTYSPNLNFAGTDSFTYSVCDTAGACATATVTVLVGPIEDPPVAANDSATTNENTAVTINVLANDTDPDGVADLDRTSVRVTSGPAHGSTSVNPVNGRITYTPNPNYNGTDTFTYQVCDMAGACATASVLVTIGLPDTFTFIAPGDVVVVHAPAWTIAILVLVAFLSFALIVLGIARRRPIAARQARRRRR